jgi:hypothetical protein
MLSHLGSRREASTLADRRRLPISSRGFGALSSIVLSLAVAASATAATPISIAGETLTSTSGSVRMAVPSCPLGFVNDSGTFTASGTATGPYPGTFTESGTLAFSGTNRGPLSFFHVYFNASFTITSPGALAITGTLSDQGFGAHCPTANVYSLSNNPASYTLTGNYSGSGAAGWPVSGALVNGAFHTDTLQATITENFAP